MKKLILGAFLGFFAHKAISAVYSYSWWTEEKNCRSKFYNEKTLREEFSCIYENMGSIKYLDYLLVSPSYEGQSWRWRS